MAPTDSGPMTQRNGENRHTPPFQLSWCLIAFVPVWVFTFAEGVEMIRAVVPGFLSSYERQLAAFQCWLLPLIVFGDRVVSFSRRIRFGSRWPRAVLLISGSGAPLVMFFAPLLRSVLDIWVFRERPFATFDKPVSLLLSLPFWFMFAVSVCWLSDKTRKTTGASPDTVAGPESRE